MYSIVNGNNGNNFINFVGITSVYAQTLINPYTGFSITINEVLNINNAIYDGLGGTDTLNMTALGDVLTLLDSEGTIMVKNVEIINASEGGDIINFAFIQTNYGNLIMRGAGGDDILWGNAGDDTLLGADGNDNIIGGLGNDFVFGGSGDDYLDGSIGVDYLAGGAGDDVLIYTADDVWTGGLTLADMGSNFFFGNMIGLDGKNRSYDSFHGDTEDDGTVISQGYDRLIMTSGNDVLLLKDILSPQSGALGARVTNIDYIDAGAGNDIVDLSGGAHIDITIDGGAGDDVIVASNGDDTILGGDGNDHISGGLGNDVLEGGAGDDVYYYALGDGSDIIRETSGNDTIRFDAGIALNDLTLEVIGEDLHILIGTDSIIIEGHYAQDGSGRVENITFDDGSTFDLGSYVPNEAPITRDDIFSAVRDTVITGNVLHDNGNGADTDANNDVLSVQPQTITTINGGTVELLADGSFTYAPATGFIGTDSFDYTAIDGKGGENAANVTLNVEYRGDDIVGTNDADTLSGTNGDDHIFGLDGDDVLYGDDSILTVTKDKVFFDEIVAPNLKEGINIAKLTPSGIPALGIAAGNLEVDYKATATITFRAGYAGNDNSFGTYGIAEDGTLTFSTVLWANVKTAGINTSHTIDIPVGSEGGQYGFFIISNGVNRNNGYKNLDITGEGNVQFVYNFGKADARAAKITDDGSKVSIVYNDGVKVQVLKGDVYFTTERGESAAINKDGVVHAVSGMIDTNNLSLGVIKNNIKLQPSAFTKNGITIDAGAHKLIAVGDSVGIKSSASGDAIGGNEVMTIRSSQAAEKFVISLSDLTGNGTGIDFKVYIAGSTTPINYEFQLSGPAICGLKTINLTSQMFGGLITHVEMSSVANSSLGTETFYLDNVQAHIPGGVDTGVIRIGFEDLYGGGDADYEDVVFDLDINPATVSDTTGGNDILDGGAGNDILYGEGGDDILIIGLGADVAYGGSGADIFAITHIDNLVDRIADFNASEGDTINLADVLEGFDPLSSDINAFVQLVQNGGDTEIHINANGDAGGAFQLAALVLGTNVDLISIATDHSALS